MSDDLSGFDGTARLFPLPNLVLFPYVIQPLHIFEPRYRQLTADALAGDRLIALVLLRPGWEGDYEGRPALHAVACLGKIIADQRLEDGRYNLLLRGLARLRVGAECEHDKLYRRARVEILTDTAAPDATAARLRRQLARLVLKWVAAQGQALDQFRRLFDTELPLGTLCDIFTFALPLEPEFKQRALEELDVRRRTRLLLARLKDQTPGEDVPPPLKFPPEFSPN